MLKLFDVMNKHESQSMQSRNDVFLCHVLIMITSTVATPIFQVFQMPFRITLVYNIHGSLDAADEW